MRAINKFEIIQLFFLDLFSSGNFVSSIVSINNINAGNLKKSQGKCYYSFFIKLKFIKKTEFYKNV